MRIREEADNGQTPQRGSPRRNLSAVPGAPVKKRTRATSKRTLKPKRLVYTDECQTKEMTQETSDTLDSIQQEMQELLETRINTVEGTWVQCDQPDCNKWRYLADVIDPSELPNKWYCSMNTDPKRNSCNAEEDSPPEDELLDTKYFVGSIVWAKVNTYPWWPAMIDDDPDLGVYEWRDHGHGLPTSYHVTFLDQKVTRAWVRDRFCMPFRQAQNRDGPAGNKIPGYYRKLFDAAVGTAEIALKLPVAERIKNYCFLNNYQGTRKSVVQAPKEKRPRGRPRKNPATDTQSGKAARPAKPKQGTKRPRSQLHVGDQEESAQDEQPRSKQPKETPKQGKKAPPGRPRKASSALPSTDAVSTQANEVMKQPRGRPRKKVDAESDQLADASQKKTKSRSQKALKSKDEETEHGLFKKAPAKPAAGTKRTLMQPIKGKLSAILSKRLIDEAKQAKNCEKGSNANKSAQIGLSNLKATTVSGQSKDTTKDAGTTVSQRQEANRTEKEYTGASSEQSVVTSSTDHESLDSRETVSAQPTKTPASNMSALPDNVEKKGKGLADITGVPPVRARGSNIERLQTDTEVTHASAGNTITQAEPNCYKAPAHAETDNATPLVPQHEAPVNKAQDSAGAGFVLSIPSFDSAEERPECFDVNSLIEFLDEDETTENKPILGTLNKAGENFDVSKTNQLLLPCDPMDLEHPMDTLPIEEPMKDAGCGSNQPRQSEPMESRSTPEVAVVEEPVPKADSETEVHVTVLAGTGFRSGQQAEQSSKISLGATGVKTSSKASTQPYKASSTSKVGSIESGTKDTTREAWNSSGGPETSNSEQVYKVKEVTKTTNKENHEPPPATARGTAPAKKGKPVSKQNRAPQEMVPPKSAAEKKPAFKVPKRDVASKTEARLSKTAALLSGAQTKANTSTAAEAKPQASLVNKKAISGKATEAMPQAKAADTSKTHTTAGTSKAAEAQATLPHVNAAKLKAGANKAAHTDMQAMSENADDALMKLSASYTVDSEDSDFESLSNTQDLTFEDTLSSISQSLEMSQEEDSDFASLEGIDGSQTFSKEE